MPLHNRHVKQKADDKIQIKYKRFDYLWKCDEPIYVNGVADGASIHFPIITSDGRAYGPTVLDMLTKQHISTSILKNDLEDIGSKHPKKIEVWSRRHISNFLRQLNLKFDQVDKTDGLDGDAKLFPHFCSGFMSTGKVVEFEKGFVKVEKYTTLVICEMTYRLAIGLYGSADIAYEKIAKLAAETWMDDLRRARTLWDKLESVPFLAIDESTINLCAQSSISRFVERLILQQVCIRMGIDPEMEIRRARGRPWPQRQKQ